MADLQQLVDTLAGLDEESCVTVITSILSARPEIAPSIVNFAVPDLTYPPAKTLTERRSSGTIKSFNPEKGYGFIECKELHDVFGNDVFMHGKQNAAGYDRGTPVTFAVVLNKDNKPQAFDVTLDDGKGSFGKGGCKGKAAAMGALGGMGGYASMMEMMGGYPGFMGMGGFGGKMGKMGKMGGKGGGKDSGKEKRKLGGGSKGPDEAEVLGQFNGTIKSFNANNGYGFVACPEVKAQFGFDVFLHHAQLGGFNVGDAVYFTCYLNSKGQPQAKDLQASGGPAKKMRLG